ncbi:MAG TPA: tetratricopeptide repeat protein [Bryobacteraceae bacterium]|jgi:tetratricopeptide (TPR) repeat protein|nr:tetratricopeptide repeat protein [Bryobacteraceae bacterium]
MNRACFASLVLCFALHGVAASPPQRTGRVVAVARNANNHDNCRALRHHGQLHEAEACFTRLTQATDSFHRAEGYWGLGRYDEANEEFRAALREQPKSALVHVEWGRMYLDHYQPGDAAKLFEEALEIDSNNAPAYLGLARVAAQAFDKRAVRLANQAMQHDAKFAEAHEFLAYLALEDGNPNLAATEAQQAIALSGEALDGMAVLASIDWLNGAGPDSKAQSPWMDRILKIDPAYGEAYATGAHFFEINRRYEEAIAWYRKALELNGALWAARSQLGVNLMRLGMETEAKQQLERCYEAHYRDAETVNSLRLLDSLKDYETFKTPTTQLVLNKKEAALLRPYIEPELQRAIATYQRKYKMTLPGPVRLEVYPNHEDFVVRTLGLPGQGGLLGVTFGAVVAMDSPSARPPGEFNWASTMWHELSHVYVLNATHHLVPRWFTEGLAVHEEGAASPDWGDRMTPDIVTALQQKKLLPVEQLDRGFLRPEYPNQVIVSYFEAGKMCDYIAQRWGNDALLGMIHSYAARKTTPEAIEENLHESAAAFDEDFQAWLDQKTANTVRHFDDWKLGIKLAYDEFQHGKQEEAVRRSLTIRDYYPDYVGGHNLYELTADFYLTKNDKAAAVRELEKYRDAGGTDVTMLKNLARLEQEAGTSKQAEVTLKKLNYVSPEDEEIHRRLGDILLQGGDAAGAVREYQAVVTLQPADKAESHYELARALNAAHRTNEAKDEVLIALEAAPGFKPAQQLLLQLSQ